MSLFGKKETSLTGDIEMVTFSSAKKLGRKRTRSNSVNLSVSNRSSIRSSNASSKNATVSSASTKRIRKITAKHIYAKRSKKSKCRGRTKSDCTRKQLCKFTKGPIRLYCRKKYNKRI
jgi:hypothetical protein